jgi:hypothetical protein
MGGKVFPSTREKNQNMTTPTHSQFAAYQQIFDYFNQTLFENQLPAGMLSYSRRRHSSHTLFTAGQWEGEAGSTTSEISLNLKQLREGEPHEILATLVREMVHLWQEMYGNPSSTGYYNREWAEKMEEVGLIPTDTGLPGGKRTGKRIEHFIEPAGRFEQAFHKLPETCLWPFRPAAHQKSEKYTLKAMYRCTGCGAKLWGKGGQEILCGCGKVFAGENGETNPGLEEKIYHILAKKYGYQGK